MNLGIPVLAEPARIVITPEVALEISTVWSCVSLISSAIATAPWHIVGSDGSRLPRVDQGLAYLLNKQPSEDINGTAFREALLIGALLWGNGYAEIGRDRHGTPMRLWPLSPSRVTPRRDADAPYALWFEYHQQDGEAVRLEARDVFHIHGPALDGLVARGIVSYATHTLALAAAADRFAESFYANGTIVGGVLQYPGRLPRDPKTGRPDATIDRLREDWEQLHRGANRSHKPAVLEQGMTWKPFETKATDAQLLEARRFAVEDIARYFAVPPHLVGIADASHGLGRNLEEMGLALVRHCLRPWARRLELEADYKLLGGGAPPRRGQHWRTELDFSEIEKPDAMTEARTNEVRLRNGVITMNEWRASEKRALFDRDGDERLIASGLQPLARLIG